MANFCYSRITFEGNGEEIRELHECIKKKWAVNVVENRYGTYWLGNMVGNAGLDWENISCRGYIEEISDVEVNDDGSVYFEITTETAWYVMVDMWYEIFKKIGFKTISLFYITEEFGCDIFETNDLEKKYYSDKYYVDYLIGSYAATVKSVLLTVSKYFHSITRSIYGCFHQALKQKDMFTKGILLLSVLLYLAETEMENKIRLFYCLA